MNDFIKLSVLFFSLVQFVPAAAGGELQHKHNKVGVSCEDCHNKSNPTRKASQKTCRSCHDISETGTKEYSEGEDRKIEFNVHDTHAGDLRCTACHSEHKPSTLYCNEACHHELKMTVP